MFIAVAAPTGGLGNFPALVQGDDGDTPNIDTAINYQALQWDDPTPNYASWTELSPNVYQLNLGLHEGEPGPPGTLTILDAGDLDGTPLAKDILIVNPSASGFIYQAQKVGDRFYPSTINNTATGNPSSTLCQVLIPPQRFDWRPSVEGACVITGTGTDVIVDLFVRLNSETGGNIVGYAFGQSGMTPPTHVLSSGWPGTTVVTDSYDRIAAGNGATIFLRAERRSGANTFTTSASTTGFRVIVNPIP